jgi:pimeloyl-ACP methyl ester carboxylesterase
MGTITTSDGTQIFYKDWGTGQPVVFSHGWPLNADAWDDQAMLVASNGYRAIAHDRRGHGRSSQPWDGNDLDTYADDLAQLLDAWMYATRCWSATPPGGGEVTRYLGRHGTTRVAKALLVSAIPPLMLKTPANPEGTPIEAFDAIRQGVGGDQGAPPGRLRCGERCVGVRRASHICARPLKNGTAVRNPSRTTRPRGGVGLSRRVGRDRGGRRRGSCPGGRPRPGRSSPGRRARPWPSPQVPTGPCG